MSMVVGLIKRWTVLAGSIGLAAAVAALGAALSAEWLAIPALAIVVLGLVFQFPGALRTARQEGEKVEQVRKARTRVPIAGVRDADPTLLGVDPAAEQQLLPGKDVPEYLPREVDGELDRAIEAALAGTGRWIAIAVGSSKVGKSRAMFETLRRQAEIADITLLAPVDHAALLEMLEPGQVPAVSGRSALWLDDLEPFADAGLTVQTLERWHEQFQPCVVVATFGGKGGTLVRGSDGERLATVAGEIRRRSQEVFLGGTSDAEIEALPSGSPPEALAAVKRHGLAAYLVAGPDLAAKLGTQRRTPTEPRCPEGVAVLFAAVDWARAGRTDPIPAATLKELWGRYLPAGGHQTADGFEVGLEWALDPVAGTISLLEEVDGYRAYDYVVELVDRRREWQVHDDSIWAAALAGATDSQALSVGARAFSRRRFEDAAAGFEIVGRSSNRPLAAMATINLGVALGQLGRVEEEIAVYEKLIEAVDGDEDELQEHIATALYNRGVAFSDMGGPTEAIASYDQAIDRFSTSDVQRAREQAVSALLNKGVKLDELGHTEEALAIYDRVLKQYGDWPGLRAVIARSMANRGSALARLGRMEEALPAYAEVDERFGDAEEPEIQEQVVAAMVGQGNVLIDLDRDAEADPVFDEVIRRFGARPYLGKWAAASLVNRGRYQRALGRDDGAIAFYDLLEKYFLESEEAMVLDSLAMALTDKANILAKQERGEEALAVLDVLIARLAENDLPELRDRLATARFNKGVHLNALGRREESTASFLRVVDDYGDDGETSVRDTVAESLLNVGVGLAEAERPEEAIAAFDDLQARFGDATESVLRKQVAMSFVDKGIALAGLDRTAEAIATFDLAVERYGDAAEPEVRMEALSALVHKAAAFASIERVEEALAAYEDAIERFGDDPDPDLREEAASVAAALAASRAVGGPSVVEPG